MSKILILLFVTLLNTSLFSQNIPAKSNTIIVTLTDSNNVYPKVVKAFTEKGYTIKNPDKITGSIITEPKTLKNNSRVNLSAIINGNEIIISGKIVVVAQGNMTIEYKGAKGTPIMMAWEEMEKVSKSIGGKISYETR